MKKLLAKGRLLFKQTINPRRHALIIIVFMHISMAFSVVHTEIGRSSDKAVLFDAWPPPLRSGLWAGAALVVAVGIFCSKFEPAAFGFAIIMPMERVVGYLWAWMHFMIPGYPPGDPWIWSNALFWICVSAMIGLMATIVHSTPPRRAE